MATYIIEVNEGFVVESLERYRAQTLRRFGRVSVKIVCFLGLALLFGICVWAKIYYVAALLAFFIALLLVGPRIDYWVMKWRLRKSPFYQHKMRIEVQKEGFKETSEISTTELKWPAFTRAVRLKDGFLVFSGPRHFHWWPDAALVEGRVQDIELLLQEKLANGVSA
jgi:hypothetical protein